ncbi:MAG: hypothetical protein CMQ27_09000 [Gammaproteobacteria bacterium]|nr:hypothetical protein [Gammaproteobacteria bacterium]|tara:strand:- start:67 stop:384 length:318 start_codon:yes stop_codon:yes gene_type:complete
MRFRDLQFLPHPVKAGGIQAKVQMGPYEVSVVDLTGKGNHYELAIFKDGRFVQLPGIHPDPLNEMDWVDDVIHNLTPMNVEGILLKLALIIGETSQPKPVDKVLN